MNSDSSTIKIINLVKIFSQNCCCYKRKIKAVNNINFVLEENEKFGLLGFNGSGKTTTFKLITKELLYDSGEIILFNKESKDFNSIKRNIGYCPQENALYDELTVKTMFKIYKKLTGINLNIEELCEKFGLTRNINTKCKNLSGGNKRKLCFALSMLNNPRILLLDEPSTGVDPESRRIMWKNILDLNLTHKYNMILSTHSMEEAEVLCDTVSWLKDGQFECIGNPEQLKIDYSTGYIFQLKFKNNKYDKNIKEDCDKLLKELKNKINGCDKLNDKIKNDCYVLNKLNFIVDYIKDKCSLIYINNILQENIIEFIIQINEEKQSILFSSILSLKSTFDFIDEISLNMQSLENILIHL